MDTYEFEHSSGIPVTQIPFKGTSPALADVLAGHVDLMFAPVNGARPLIQSGKRPRSPLRLFDFPPTREESNSPEGIAHWEVVRGRTVARVGDLEESLGDISGKVPS